MVGMAEKALYTGYPGQKMGLQDAGGGLLNWGLHVQLLFLFLAALFTSPEASISSVNQSKSHYWQEDWP